MCFAVDLTFGALDCVEHGAFGKSPVSYILGVATDMAHDEEGMRHFYDEWGKWMNRHPGNPDLTYEEGRAA